MRAKPALIAVGALAVSAIFIQGSIGAADEQACCGGDASCTTETTAETVDTTDEQVDVIKLSEAFGHLIGRNLETPGITFDLEGIIKGMRDAAAGIASPMTDEEYEEAMSAIQESAFQQLAETNLEDANSFLQSNSVKDTIVELETGKLQYEVLNQGDGREVAADSVPTIQYRGTYLDGTTFGSSEETGPISLPLAQTIPGFSKGLVGMKEGEKRKLYIHPDLGYGTMGHLPPNSLLIFEVEIVSAGDFEESTQTIADAEPSTEEASL